jgi:hypothetical protein
VPAGAGDKESGDDRSHQAPQLADQLAKVLPSVAAVLTIVMSIYGNASPYARTRSGKVWFTLGVSAALLLIVITMVLLYNLGRYDSRKITVSVPGDGSYDRHHSRHRNRRDLPDLARQINVSNYKGKPGIGKPGGL